MIQISYQALELEQINVRMTYKWDNGYSCSLLKSKPHATVYHDKIVPEGALVLSIVLKGTLVQLFKGSSILLLVQHSMDMWMNLTRPSVGQTVPQK